MAVVAVVAAVGDRTSGQSDYHQGMEKKRASETGIRMEIITGTDEAVALDALVDDFIHGNTKGALKELHEPHEAHDGGAAESKHAE